MSEEIIKAIVAGTPTVSKSGCSVLLSFDTSDEAGRFFDLVWRAVADALPDNEVKS
jgi:hypothetical protein